MTYSLEGVVPEDKIEELEQAVKEAFPKNMKVDVRINPDGRVRIFEVETMLEVDDIRDYNLAFQMLQDMNYTVRDIETGLKEMRMQDGDPNILLPYIQTINLDPNQFGIGPLFAISSFLSLPTFIPMYPKNTYRSIEIGIPANGILLIGLESR